MSASKAIYDTAGHMYAGYPWFVGKVHGRQVGYVESGGFFLETEEGGRGSGPL